MLMSPDQELRLGEAAYTQLIQKFGTKILPEYHPVTQMVRKVAMKIIEESGFPELQQLNWEVFVVNSPEANAFVIPGGKIFVFSGILPILKDEEGMATVLSHEIGHTYARHIAEQNTMASLLSSLGLAIYFVTGIDPALINLPQSIFQLRHSRQCELEADYIGLLMMSRACYNPDKAVDLWKRMEKMVNKLQPPEFLSTHPSHGQRIEYIQNHLTEAHQEWEHKHCHLRTFEDACTMKHPNSKVAKPIRVLIYG